MNVLIVYSYKDSDSVVDLNNIENEKLITQKNNSDFECGSILYEIIENSEFTDNVEAIPYDEHFDENYDGTEEILNLTYIVDGIEEVKNSFVEQNRKY